MDKANSCSDYAFIKLMASKSYGMMGIMISFGGSKKIGRSVTMRHNKVVLKDDQKTVFVHPIVHNNGTGMFNFPQGVTVRERLERKNSKSGQLHFMSLQWKSTYNQGTKPLRGSGKYIFLQLLNESLNIFNMAVF